MKKYFTLTAVCAALILSSCKKEDLNGTVTNSASSAGSLAKATTLKLAPSKTTVYGAMIETPSSLNTTSFQLNVADQLGVSSLRARTLVPGNGIANPLLTSSYKVLLNFNITDYNTGAPTPFVKDLNKYKIDLSNILSTFTVMPAVSVIENEESNRNYYSGSVQDYIKQLTVAINVMHAQGIKVTNGGVTDRGLMYLTYMDFLNQGKYDSAQRFKQLTGINPKNRILQDRGAVVDTLLNAYKTMSLDYVNFHWKATSPDTEALTDVINYLRKSTGKTIINNELGQFDTDPNTLRLQVQKCTDEGFPYIIWYSPNEDAGKQATPLQHTDQSLTPTGIAYQNYLKN